MVTAELLDTKLTDYFSFAAKPSEPMVTAKYMLSDNQDDVDEFLTRVRAGEDFHSVASEKSRAIHFDRTPARGGSAAIRIAAPAGRKTVRLSQGASTKPLYVRPASAGRLSFLERIRRQNDQHDEDRTGHEAESVRL